MLAQGRIASGVGLSAICWIAAFGTCAWLTACASRAAEVDGQRIVLDGCTIQIDSDLPSYAQYAAKELRDYLREITGREVRLTTAAHAAPEATARTTIVLGRQGAASVGVPLPNAESDADERFSLRSLRRGDAWYIVGAGATARGTRHAAVQLLKRVRAEGKAAYVEGPFALSVKPSFAKRGIHLNGWAFHAPYTFRNWTEPQWRRYVDMLALEGVNLFYLWPFIEIMPVPLSREDRAYLEECRRLVDYAQKKHGMEVWIMQCTNRVAKDRCGVADPRKRPYWRPSQEDLNPGNPEHLKAILASREALCAAINNVDGVCNIDSDPGYYAGSPLADYLNALRGFRASLDKHNLHGKQAKLVNWMWCGWGLPHARAFEARHQEVTIDMLRRDLPEPWWLVNGQFDWLPLCQRQGVLPKTVLLPYGLIEGEPSYPSTNVAIDSMRIALDAHLPRFPKLAGVMGNVQTPLLQLPHAHYFTSVAWDLDYRKRSEAEVLRDLAEQVYPEHARLLADSYGALTLALAATEPERAAALSRELTSLADRNALGRPGVLGRKLFPDQRIVATSLAAQLRLAAARERLVREAAATLPRARCVALVREYFDAYLAWDTAHGWHSLWGWTQWPLGMFPSDPRYAGMTARLRKSLGDEVAVRSCFEQAAAALVGKYGDEPVRVGCVEPLQSAVLAAATVESLAQKAKATASVVPDPGRYPPGAANDGSLATLYWPGALVQNNNEWLQLTWKEPQTIRRVVVRFLQHPSMRGRTIRLQRQSPSGAWEDFATTVVPNNAKARHAVATFILPTPVTTDRIRVVNLLDLFEIEVY